MENIEVFENDKPGLDAAMTDTITEKLREIRERDGVTPEELAKKETAPVETEPKETESKPSEKPRDSTGKFAKAEKNAAAPDTSTPKPESEAVEQTAAATTQADDLKSIDLTRPPSSWKPAGKAAWKDVPAAVREEVYRRENAIHANFGSMRDNADFGQRVSKVVEPYRGLIQAEGGTPERAIEDTLRTAALFRTGTPQAKQQAMLALDRQFNVGFIAEIERQVTERLTGQQSQPAQQPAQTAYQDPRVDTLMQHIERQQREQSAQDERTRSQASDKFLAAKDASGQPLHPFVDNVIEDMSDRIGTLRRLNPSASHDEILQQAYEAAVWANPETRAVLMSQQQATATQSAETLRKVEQAKRANAGNMPKRGSLPAQAPVGSMEDTIRETGRELGLF